MSRCVHTSGRLICGKPFSDKGVADALKDCPEHYPDGSLAVFDFIEGFYNTKRRHSSIGYLAPAVFETRASRAATTACPRADTPSSVLPLKGEEAPRLAHAAAPLPAHASAQLSSKPRRHGSASTP